MHSDAARCFAVRTCFVLSALSCMKGWHKRSEATGTSPHTCPQMVLEGESSGGQAPHSRGPTSLQKSTSNTVVFPFNSS